MSAKPNTIATAHGRTQTREPLVHLEIIRGVSALLVVMHHVRVVFFPSVAAVPNELKDVWLNGYIFLSGFNRGPVLVFFTLSGYLIIRRVVNSFGSWSWAHYFAERLSRLWAVLIPSLLITMLIVFCGRLIWPGYAGGYGHMVASDGIRIGISAFFGNLFFLQTLLVDVYGDNGALWTLSYEFWYYVLFPLLLLTIIKSGIYKYIVMSCFVVLLCIIARLNADILYLFPCWLLGGLAVWYETYVHAWVRAWRAQAAVALAYVALLVAVVMHRIARSESVYADYLLSSVVTGFICVAIGGRRFKVSASLREVAAFISSRSYTTYLMHYSIVGFMFYVIFEGRKVLPSALNIGIAGAVITVVLILTWLLYLPFERNTPILRNWLISRSSFGRSRG